MGKERSLTVAAAAVAFGILIAVAAGDIVGREKFVHRELDLTEDLTGIILRAAAVALFAGDAVVIGRNEKLRIPLQTDQGELAQCQVDPAALGAEVKVVSEAGTDAGGDFVAVAFAAVTLAAVYQLHAQNNGVHGLYHSGGHIALK